MVLDAELARRFKVTTVPQLFVREGRVAGALEELALEALLNEQSYWQPGEWSLAVHIQR